MWKQWETKTWQRADAQKMEVKGSDEDRGGDGRTALREIRNEGEDKGEKGHGNLTSDDSDDKRTTI